MPRARRTDPGCQGRGGAPRGRSERLGGENGLILRREVPLTPDIADALGGRLDALGENHGRELGPDELVFPEVPHQEVLEHEIVSAMKLAGVEPAIIYAYEKTGRILTTENLHLISDEDLTEWNVAIDEYEGRTAAGEADPVP